MPPSKPVGIDLGTTFSAIAYLDETGKPVTIPNREGELTTPSAILFEEDNIVVGREAIRAALTDPGKVVQFIKREVGTPRYRYRVGQKNYTPEELSAMILKKLKQDAERKIGPIEDAVITVPAYFDDTRRKATQDAGRIAGLNVLDIINEPTAAALAYGMGKLGNDEVALVYDLGGGTFDVTLVQISGRKIQMRATDGDVRLGGKEWDDRILNYVAEKFMEETGENPRDDAQSHNELAERVEEAKRALSERRKVRIPCSHAGRRLSVELTKDEFEHLTEDLLGRTEMTTQLVLEQSGLSWDAVNRVLLVGGSTRMPMVRSMLELITGKEPDASLPADEVVAWGAAIHAGIRSLRKPGGARGFTAKVIKELKDVVEINVNSHSLGIAAFDPKTKKRVNAIIIKKNTPLPHSAKRLFKTPPADGKAAALRIRVLEGESKDPDACIQIGECLVKLPADLAGGSPIQISFSYDESGRIGVHALDMTRGREAKTEIIRDTGMSNSQIDKATADLSQAELE
ncbi:MAG: Hsp70 family protein [Planctomycetes bacterium]|nr:Hsp70 family protein [Planctomycetota bacterium]